MQVLEKHCGVSIPSGRMTNDTTISRDLKGAFKESQHRFLKENEVSVCRTSSQHVNYRFLDHEFLKREISLLLVDNRN